MIQAEHTTGSLRRSLKQRYGVDLPLWRMREVVDLIARGLAAGA